MGGGQGGCEAGARCGWPPCRSGGAAPWALRFARTDEPDTRRRDAAVGVTWRRCAGGLTQPPRGIACVQQQQRKVRVRRASSVVPPWCGLALANGVAAFWGLATIDQWAGRPHPLSPSVLGGPRGWRPRRRRPGARPFPAPFPPPWRFARGAAECGRKRRRPSFGSRRARRVSAVSAAFAPRYATPLRRSALGRRRQSPVSFIAPARVPAVPPAARRSTRHATRRASLAQPPRKATTSPTTRAGQQYAEQYPRIDSLAAPAALGWASRRATKTISCPASR